MALITVTIPNPVLPVGWVFKVEIAALVFGMPPVWTPLPDQTNAPFNLILTPGGYALRIRLDMDGTLCEAWYWCFRVHPPCVGCPSPVNISFYQGQGVKYLQVDMQFPSGFPSCGLEIHAWATGNTWMFNQTSNITSLGQLTPVIIGMSTYYRKVFVISGFLNWLILNYTVNVRSFCCSYHTQCYNGNATG